MQLPKFMFLGERVNKTDLDYKVKYQLPLVEEHMLWSYKLVIYGHMCLVS